jgi:hypothetical protein
MPSSGAGGETVGHLPRPAALAFFTSACAAAISTLEAVTLAAASIITRVINRMFMAKAPS